MKRITHGKYITPANRAEFQYCESVNGPVRENRVGFLSVSSCFFHWFWFIREFFHELRAFVRQIFPPGTCSPWLPRILTHAHDFQLSRLIYTLECNVSIRDRVFGRKIIIWLMWKRGKNKQLFFDVTVRCCIN